MEVSRSSISNQVSLPLVKESRRNRLVESISSLRTEDKADVSITSGGKQFFAHRLILEASSPFFITAFQETEDGILTFEDIEPEILEVVLNFIYLGEADTLNNAHEIKKVMEVSVRLDLEELFEYCAAILIESLNNNNFVEIWETAIQYQHKEMLKKTHYYLVNNAGELVNTDQFLQSTLEQIIELINYTKAKVPCIDMMFLAIVNWIRYGLEEREGHTKMLFALVSPESLSRPFMKSMLEDKELMNCSTELFNCMNAMGVGVFVFSPKIISTEYGQIRIPITVQCRNVKCNYFCEYKVEDFYDATINRTTKRIKPYCLMQQFDLHSMTWQPSKKICFTGFKGAALLQHGRHIYFVGGMLDSVYAVFDVANDSIEYIDCRDFNGRIDAALCIFKDYLYLIGGHTSDVALASCFRVLPGNRPWTEVTSLKYARGYPIALASANYIYITGSRLESDRAYNVIEYLYEKNGQLECGTITIRNVPRNLPLHFLVSNNILYGFYIYNNDLVRIWYDHTANTWIAKAFPTGPQAATAINRIVLKEGKGLLFVSTITKGLRLPTYVWEPDSGSWTALPPIQGKCELPESEPLPHVYTVGI